MIDTILADFGKYFPEIERALGGGVLVFARLMGFIRFAPLFNRKEIPTMLKLSFVFIMTVILTMLLKPPVPPVGNQLAYDIMMNIVFGALVGWVAQCILTAIEAGGDMINMQMGLSAATVLDPTTQNQSSILGKFFSLVGLLIFISVGGVYWLFQAFIRGFEVFPLYAHSFSLQAIVNMDYVIRITSNVLFMGMQIAAPVLLATLGQDIILGIISKTAPQVNVFQLSFLFKPVLGAAILIWILPMLLNVINDYFVSYSHIF